MQSCTLYNVRDVYQCLSAVIVKWGPQPWQWSAKFKGGIHSHLWLCPLCIMLLCLSYTCKCSRKILRGSVFADIGHIHAPLIFTDTHNHAHDACMHYTFSVHAGYIHVHVHVYVYIIQHLFDSIYRRIGQLSVSSEIQGSVRPCMEIITHAPYNMHVTNKDCP